MSNAALTPFTPFELPPPRPSRPIQWRRAKRLVGELLDNPENTDKVFELMDAMGGQGDEPTVQRFAAHPAGLQLFLDRPLLLDALSDRDELQALPAASFGRGYLAFARQNGFAADGILEANERGLGEANAQVDEHRRWFFDRVGLMHDLWHVLTGYDTDPAGEAALLAFSIGQGLSSRTLRFLLFTLLVIAPKSDRFAFQRFAFQAYRRGRRAGPLFVQRYEELLIRPLSEVRRQLEIEPIRDAHPDGIFRAGSNPRDIARVMA